MDKRKIDWVEEFERKFGGNQFIATLREGKFHGKVEINFAEGVANTCHVNWCVKPYTGIVVSNKENTTITG